METKFWVFLSSLTFAISSFALASNVDTFKVGPLTRNDTNTRVVVHYFDKLTKVEFSNFEVVVPAGWSINPVGEGAHFSRGLTLAPGKNIENSPVYLVVNQLSSPPKVSMSEREAKHRAAGRTIKKQSIAGMSWIIAQGEEGGASRLYGHAEQRGISYVMVAGAPKNDRKSLATIESVFQSFKVK